MEIFVFAYNRVPSLKVLWESLVKADYIDKKVDLTVCHDKVPGVIHGPIHEWLDTIKWPHGKLTIRRNEENVGLKRNIIEAWLPMDAYTFGAFFEDDIEVSPYWFVWADAAIKKYYFPKPHPKMLGLSLYKANFDVYVWREAYRGRDNQPFVVQQPASWGEVFFPRPWRYFRQWIRSVGDGNLPVRVMSNRWAPNSSWLKFVAKLVHDDGLFLVYPNLPNSTSLSAHHEGDGVHTKAGQSFWKKLHVNLFSEEDLKKAEASGIKPFNTPDLSELMVYDLTGRSVPNVHGLINGGSKLPLGYLFPEERRTASRVVYNTTTIIRVTRHEKTP